MRKDIQWLKEEFDDLFNGKSILTVGKSVVDEILNQLDEPEVLSQEWVDEHEQHVTGLGIGKNSMGQYRNARVVSVYDLQNLLVPKQELPVIPNYVAKWISIHHEQFDLYPALKRLENNALSWEDVYEWYRKNTRKFVNAYLTGKYEVEEEQKYMVPIDENHALCKFTNVVWGIYKESTDKLYLEDYFKFTEQEIKGYDERYWPFAVKVEELEE